MAVPPPASPDMSRSAPEPAHERRSVPGPPHATTRYQRIEGNRADGERFGEKGAQSSDGVFLATPAAGCELSAITAPDLDRAIDAGIARLIELQEPGGWWVGELESNVTMTAQHLLFLEFMGLRDDETTMRVMAELLAQQRPDGLWSIYHGGEPDLNATLEAYAALRLAGLSELRSSAGRGETILRGAGRDRRRTGLHAYLVVAVRNLALGRGASALPGARAAPAGTARVPLHVCLLGASDRAPAVGRHALQAGAKDGARARLSRARSRPARAGTPQCLGRRRPAPQALCAQPVQAGAQARACPRGTLDHRPAGARRILGRYSASLGVVA